MGEQTSFLRVRDLWNRQRGKLVSLIGRLDRSTAGVFTVVHNTLRSYGQARGPEAAASIAFYAFFSLFPLLAIFVGILSFLIRADQIRLILLQFLEQVFPVAGSLVTENLERFIYMRGTISLIGAVTLLWSASNVFSLLIFNINRAWEKAKIHSFLQNRLLALSLIGIILVIFVLFTSITTILDLLTYLQVPGLGRLLVVNTPVWKVLTETVTLLVTFLFFLILYRWVPNTRVRYIEAFWGALVVTLVWGMTALLFNWYVGSGLARYDFLYGSLATITVLMFWFFLNCQVLLIGAHLCSEIARRHLLRRKGGALVFDGPPDSKTSPGEE